MINEEKMRQQVLDQLENLDWDMSDEGLSKIANRLKSNFRNMEEARDFVDSQASYLYEKIDEYYS